MSRLSLIVLNVLEVMGTELVPETSEKLQILMQLCAWENFIEFTLCESWKTNIK